MTTLTLKTYQAKNGFAVKVELYQDGDVTIYRMTGQGIAEQVGTTRMNVDDLLDTLLSPMGMTAGSDGVIYDVQALLDAGHAMLPSVVVYSGPFATADEAREAEYEIDEARSPVTWEGADGKFYVIKRPALPAAAAPLTEDQRQAFDALTAASPEQLITITNPGRPDFLEKVRSILANALPGVADVDGDFHVDGHQQVFIYAAALNAPRVADVLTAAFPGADITWPKAITVVSMDDRLAAALSAEDEDGPVPLSIADTLKVMRQMPPQLRLGIDAFFLEAAKFVAKQPKNRTLDAAMTKLQELIY